jgi:hypothetical protein
MFSPVSIYRCSQGVCDPRFALRVVTGFGNRYQQTANGQTSTYTLDQAAGLSQVLNDGTSSYFYGLGRISQQKNGVSETFLTDGLGSVRQLANPGGTVTFGQAFDPFGNSIG